MLAEVEDDLVYETVPVRTIVLGWLAHAIAIRLIVRHVGFVVWWSR